MIGYFLKKRSEKLIKKDLARLEEGRNKLCMELQKQGVSQNVAKSITETAHKTGQRAYVQKPDFSVAWEAFSASFNEQIAGLDI